MLINGSIFNVHACTWVIMYSWCVKKKPKICINLFGSHKTWKSGSNSKFSMVALWRCHISFKSNYKFRNCQSYFKNVNHKVWKLAVVKSAESLILDLIYLKIKDVKVGRCGKICGHWFSNETKTWQSFTKIDQYPLSVSISIQTWGTYILSVLSLEFKPLFYKQATLQGHTNMSLL